MSQPTPQSAQQPATQAYPGYPGYANTSYPYASYPNYPYYGYPYYPSVYQPYAQPVPPRSPSERPGKPGAARIRNLVVAIVGVVLTIAAIAAASTAATNGQTAPSPASGGLRQVYSQQLSDVSDWSLDRGCVAENNGLLADGSSSGAVCRFEPSAHQDLLSQGFQVAVVMAPGEAVPTLEEGGILLDQDGGRYFIDFDQQGSFFFNVEGDTTASVKGSTIAWHADASLANTITVNYSATNHALDVYVNGQRIFTHSLTLDQTATVGLAAPDGAEALFTSFALYSATPG